MSERKPSTQGRPDEAWATTLAGDESLHATIRASAPITTRVAPEVLPRAHLRFAAEFSETPPEAASDTSTSTQTSNAAPMFEIRVVLGRGGMGVVYEARQASLQRAVALKMAHPRETGSAPLAPEAQEILEQRFVAEALVTGELDHPNIVPVHELGRDLQGNLFLAMKRVRGTPWSTLLEQPWEPQALRPQLEVLLKVCDAIAFAHAHGIVHRDLKPENVMVGEFGEVLVMDWGIAVDIRRDSDGPRKAEPIELASPRAGTLAYMAPEVARGEQALINITTDVYLLGGILYEVLTGTPPHKGDTVWGVLSAAADGYLEAPEARAPQRKIPGELSRVAQKALAADPAHRFPDVPSFAKALRLFLAHEDALRLADEAALDFQRLRTPGGVPRAQRYALYATVLARLRDARKLWNDNEALAETERSVALEYADEAIDRNDYGLAAAQLNALAAEQGSAKERVEQLRAAVHFGTRSRTSAWIVAALFAAVAFGGWRTLKHLHRDAPRTEERRQQLDEAHRTARLGLDAAREGDLETLRSTLATFDRIAGNREDLRATHDTLRWCIAVLLWRSARWTELSEELAKDLPATPQALWQRVHDDTSVAKALRERLSMRSNSVDERRNTRPLSLWSAAFDWAVLGGELSEMLALEQQLARDGEGVARSNFDQERRALRMRALWTTFCDHAPRASKSEQCQQRSTPFLLRQEHPDEAPVTVSWNPAGRWVAREEFRTRWEAPEPPDSSFIRYALLGSRTVLTATAGFITERLRTNGTIVSRYAVDGEVWAFWPDPRAPSELRALVSSSARRADGRPVTLEAFSPRNSMRSAANGQWNTIRNNAQWFLRDAESRANAAPVPGTTHPQRVLALLQEESETDGTGASVLLAMLNAMQRSGASPEQFQAMGERIRRQEALGPMALLQFGGVFEPINTAAAEQFYELARARFYELHPNLDLAIGRLGPSTTLRSIGEERYKTRDYARALALLERRREFSTQQDGDLALYRRYALWRKEHSIGLTPEVLARRIEEARSGGGDGLLTEFAVLPSAIAELLVAISFLVLLVVPFRAWSRAREGRLQDLYARGYRSLAQRTWAFFWNPVERITYTFPAYMPRWERALVLLVAGTILASEGVVAAMQHRIREYQEMPPSLTQGTIASEAAHRWLLEREPLRREHASMHRLLAESHHARGDTVAARRAIEQTQQRAPNHAVELNNLGVLAEEAGDRTTALAHYERAARAGNPVARWNLARSTGATHTMTAIVASMEHRDAMLAGASQRPHWARASFTDLRTVFWGDSTLWQEAPRALIEEFRDDFRPFLSAIVSVERVPTSARQWIGYGVLYLFLMTFLSLPMPVRQAYEEPFEERWTRRLSSLQGSFAKLDLRWIIWLRGSLAIPALLAPGLWELLFGRLGIGAGLLYVLGEAWSLRLAILRGNIFGPPAIAQRSSAYFSELPANGAFPELLPVAQLALFALILLYLGHTFWMVFRFRSWWQHRNSKVPVS